MEETISEQLRRIEENLKQSMLESIEDEKRKELPNVARLNALIERYDNYTNSIEVLRNKTPENSQSKVVDRVIRGNRLYSICEEDSSLADKKIALLKSSMVYRYDGPEKKEEDALDVEIRKGDEIIARTNELFQRFHAKN